MKSTIASLSTLATLIVSLSASALPCDNPERLTFSFVPQGGVRSDAETFKPLIERVHKLTDKAVTIITPTSYASVVEGLIAGNIDFALLGPATYASAKKVDPSITVFATLSRKAGVFDSGGTFYHSLLITKGNERFNDIASLRGTTLALTDPGSTSGSIVPHHAFPKASGQALESYFGKVVYAGDHIHASLAVLNGQVDAAFVDSEHLSNLIQSGKAVADDFKVIWRSEPIPHEAFVYRNKLCASIKEKIINVFLKSSAEQNKLFFEKYQALSFIPVNDEDYRLIREMY